MTDSQFLMRIAMTSSKLVKNQSQLPVITLNYKKMVAKCLSFAEWNVFNFQVTTFIWILK